LQTENSLVISVERYENAVDQFKILIGMPVTQELQIVPIELEVRVPEITEEKAVDLALQYRLDYRTARDRADDAQRSVANAKNGLLPELDFNANSSIGPRSGDSARDINDDTLQYSASLELDLPIDRLPERNSYRRSLISLERAQRNVGLTRDRIVGDVQESLRGIRSAKASLEIARQGIEVAEDRLELENELLKQGTGDSENVVEAQEDLLSAQDDYDQARADLQIAVLQFLRDTGTLRVDPTAGALGQALDRELAAAENRTLRVNASDRPR
jgi:outer membrane protein TolC